MRDEELEAHLLSLGSIKPVVMMMSSETIVLFFDD